MPRIRSGSNIYPAEEVTPLNIIRNSVVCEVFYKISDPQIRTNLQWYNNKGSSLMLTSETNDLATNIKNLTSTFRLVNAHLNLYKKASYFECCTLNGENKSKCTKAYLSNSILITGNYFAILLLLFFLKFV